ncbi:unnamed protein product [Musa textilis]
MFLRCRNGRSHGLHGFKSRFLGLKLLYDVQLHVVLKHKPGIHCCCIILLGFPLHQGGRRENDGVTAWVVERGDGHPVAVRLRHHPVQHALVLAIRDDLHGRIQC